MLQLSSPERFAGGIAVPAFLHSPPVAQMEAQTQVSSLLVAQGPEYMEKSVPTAGSRASTARWALAVFIDVVDVYV